MRASPRKFIASLSVPIAGLLVLSACAPSGTESTDPAGVPSSTEPASPPASEAAEVATNDVGETPGCREAAAQANVATVTSFESIDAEEVAQLVDVVLPTPDCAYRSTEVMPDGTGAISIWMSVSRPADYDSITTALSASGAPDTEESLSGRRDQYWADGQSQLRATVWTGSHLGADATETDVMMQYILSMGDLEPADPAAPTEQTPSAQTLEIPDTSSLELWDDQACPSTAVVSAILGLPEPYEPALVMPESSFGTYDAYYCGYLPTHREGARGYIIALGSAGTPGTFADSFAGRATEVAGGNGKVFVEKFDYMYHDEMFTVVLRSVLEAGGEPIAEERAVALLERIASEWAMATGY